MLKHGSHGLGFRCQIISNFWADVPHENLGGESETCPPNWALSMQDPCLKVGQTCAVGPTPRHPRHCPALPHCNGHWTAKWHLLQRHFVAEGGDKLNVGVAEFTIEARLRCTLGFWGGPFKPAWHCNNNKANEHMRLMRQQYLYIY